MSLLDESLGADASDDSALRELDNSIQAETDPLKRASLFERQNAHLKRTLDTQKQRLHNIKEKELDLASSDLTRLQERMEQLAAENKELEKLASQGNGMANKSATFLPLTENVRRDAPLSALDVLARESAAYVKKIETLESNTVQLIQRLRVQEEEEAEARRAKQVEALMQENRAFAARIEKFEETTVASMQSEIAALKVELEAVRKQVPPSLTAGTQQAVSNFVSKYGRLAQESELQGKINAELEVQCEQLRTAHAQLEEHNVTLAAALKASQLEVEQLRFELTRHEESARASAEERARLKEEHERLYASLATNVKEMPQDEHETPSPSEATEPASRTQLPLQSDGVSLRREESASALPTLDQLQAEREHVEVQLRALRTALLGLEAENGGLRQDNQRLHNEVAILDSENKRLFDETQRNDSLRDEVQALRLLLTDTARQRTELARFLEADDRGALDEAFVTLLRLLDDYEKYVASRTGRVSRRDTSAAALAETHAEELRELWQHASASNRNLLRLLTQQTSEFKSLQEQTQTLRLRHHMLVDSSNGLKSALARAASELEEWHNRALAWEKERVTLQADCQHWMSLVYTQAKEDLEEHRALLGLASSQRVVGS